MNEKFNIIDFETWSRKDYFYYFTQMLPTGYSVSIEVDITNTYEAIKKCGKKFFPAYLYVASMLITKQQEFRISKLNDQIGYYDVLHPSYACFHKDDNTMSNMWTEYDPDFEKFYKNYMDDRIQYAHNHGILAKLKEPPKNSVMIGIIPWIKFKSYTPTPFINTGYFFPILEAGQFFERDNRKIMPFSFSVHHACADGYHVALFLERFQHAMNNPQEWIASCEN